MPQVHCIQHDSSMQWSIDFFFFRGKHFSKKILQILGHRLSMTCVLSLPEMKFH